MNEPYETHEHAGLLIEIHQDDGYDHSPLKHNDHAGTLHTWRTSSGRGELYDADESMSEPDWMIACEACSGTGADPDETCEQCKGQSEVACEPEVFWRKLYEAELAIPLNYDDRGPYSTFDPSDWEDANCAWLFSAKDLEEWGYKSFEKIGSIDWMRTENWLQGRLAQQVVKNAEAIKKVTEYTHAQVTEISDWLRGNVWGYVIREPCEDEDGVRAGRRAPANTLGSCWGYIGDPDAYILEEAKSEAEAIAEQKENPAPVGR